MIDGDDGLSESKEQKDDDYTHPSDQVAHFAGMSSPPAEERYWTMQCVSHWKSSSAS